MTRAEIYALAYRDAMERAAKLSIQWGNSTRSLESKQWFDGLAHQLRDHEAGAVWLQLDRKRRQGVIDATS